MKKKKSIILAGIIAFTCFLAGFTIEPAEPSVVYAARIRPFDLCVTKQQPDRFVSNETRLFKSNHNKMLSSTALTVIADEEVALTDSLLTENSEIPTKEDSSNSARQKENEISSLESSPEMKEISSLESSLEVKETSSLESSQEVNETSSLESIQEVKETSSLESSLEVKETSSLESSLKVNETAEHPCLIREAGVSDSDYELALSLYNNLPASVQTKLVNSGWHIVLSGTSLKSRMQLSYSILGTTVYTEKKIYLDHRTHAIQAAFYHELGHVIAYLYDSCDCTNEFIDIYFAEKDTVIDVHETGDRYGASCCTEFFATIVDDILSSNDTYAYSAPQAFTYVKQYLYR